MGSNDWIKDKRPILPAIAGADGPLGFEPSDDWLKSAAPDPQREAMRKWFLARYWDPANETPYDKEDGYIYVHGGPYDAGDELHGRFSGLVSEGLIDEVVEDVQRDGIYEWAPIHTQPDYDEEFEFAVFRREDAYRSFQSRLTEVDGLRAVDPTFPRFQ